MSRSTRNTTTTAKKLLAGLLLFSMGYLWGGLTFVKQIFPFEQLRFIKQAVFHEPSEVMRPGPNTMWQERRDQFKLFGRQAEVVMIGDSITQSGHWRDIFPEAKIANRGIKGDRTDDILRRMDTILSAKPEKAFIMVGINDFTMGKSVDKVFTDYLKIVNELQSNNIQTYIQSTLECSNCGERLEKVRLLNLKLERLAAERNLTFININNGLTSKDDGLLPEYTNDGIHLTAGGYVKWSQTIATYISSN